ncbi:hypothetical protein RV12_GL001263 [Enterococcus quebecensis]|nr:hypothetical protein RV12_GL001263 [Enterococcus quebecensis]
MANGKDGICYDTYTGVDPAMKVFGVANVFVSKTVEMKESSMVETKLVIFR